MFDFSAFPILTTERLRLRQITHADADSMIAIFGSPEMMRYLSQPPTETHEQAVGLIDWFAGNYEQQIGIDWAITHDEQMIGMCGLYGWDRENRHVDLGYHVIPSYWGQGYATEAAKAIIGWGFYLLDVHRIQADCTDGNIGSERVMLKCGFKYEGLWRESCWEHGRFVDIKQFGLLRREFEG
jgi:ribosomal-protein-alanine N-acetyltransferase